MWASQCCHQDNEKGTMLLEVPLSRACIGSLARDLQSICNHFSFLYELPYFHETQLVVSYPDCEDDYAKA